MDTIHDEGWIKLYRKSIDSQVFQSEGLWKVWTWCLLRANHEERWVPVKTGKGTTEVHIKRGQLIFGRKAASKELKMPQRTVYDRMLKLARMQNLAIQPATHYSIITIQNYELYQDNEIINPTPNPTTNQQPTNTNKNYKNNKRYYVEGSDELRLSSLLLKEILRNKPNFKQPNLQSWAREIDLMIRRDGRKPERIREVILWCQHDSFWWKNILSAGTLRKQFDRLEAEMMSKNKPASSAKAGKPEYQDLTEGGVS